MSDNKERDEKAGDHKKVGKKLLDQNEKCNLNKDSDSQLNKNTSCNDIEECSGKNPKLKKDLKELFDKFGQSHSDPKVIKSPIYSSEMFDKNEERACESYSQQSIENITSVNDCSRENNSNSKEDTTLDGKFIEIKDDSCECHAEKCICGQTDQNYTDNDESQIRCDTDDVLLSNDYRIYPTTNCVTDHKKCGCEENTRPNRTNRYNCNEVHIRYNQPETAVFDNFFPRREKLSKHRIFKDDSGETIPQLYKANIKHLPNCRIVPERFTFKAVTGNLPGKLEYAPYSYCPNKMPNTYSCYPKIKHGVNFLDDNLTEEGKNKRKEKKGKRCIFKNLKRNKRTKINEKNKSNIYKNECGIYNKNYDSFDKACLKFEGNEYVSTKQLPDRIDIYCFDHLNTSYFRTCDQPPPLITDIAMEKTEEVATRFWAEIFGFIHVIIAFFIAFILQFYKFLLYSIVRPIMVGLVQLTSDYFFKPLLTITYNGFTQPFLVFLFNVAASFRDLCSPIAKGIGYFVSEIAVLIRSINLVDCRKYTTAHRQVKDSCC